MKVEKSQSDLLKEWSQTITEYSELGGTHKNRVQLLNEWDYTHGLGVVSTMLWLTELLSVDPE